MHTPLHLLPEQGIVFTAGRWQGGRLRNAHGSVKVLFDDEPPTERSLVKVVGHIEDGEINVHRVQVIFEPSNEPEMTLAENILGEVLVLRRNAYREIRRYFDSREFVEVETPNWVRAPGTDVHLDPLAASLIFGEREVAGYLHTSPEFYMKELLSLGVERCYQICKVYRNGEVSAIHNPEFTILEWYRAWEPLEAIIADVQYVATSVVPQLATREFITMTMQEVVMEAAGIDILNCLDVSSLEAACQESGALKPRPNSDWDELFFELVIEKVDPYLASKGCVFVTDWPAPLAVLAAKDPDDPRIAKRFELYVDGVEIANGFQELTDPDEQRRRFEADNAERGQKGKPELPIPERFLSALGWGLPPSAGVAVGLDRLLMLAHKDSGLESVVPFYFYE